jgi:hypothetical protein
LVGRKGTKQNQKEESVVMAKYFIKSIFNGWCEVPKESYKAFKDHIIKHSNPQKITKEEIINQRTKVVED